MTRRGASPGAAIAACHLAALCALSIAQPVYDLLGRNPAFFVAHHAGPADIVLFAFVVLLGPAALVASFVGLLAPIGGRSRWPLLVAVALLVGLVGLPPLHRLLGAPAWMPIGIAAGVGLLAAVAYARLAAVRGFVTLLAPLALVFPLLFLLYSPVARLVRPADKSPLSTPGVRSTVPIVFVVFDGLSLESLLDASGSIDAVRYPAFARLARTATWYRGTTAVADVTELAVPAILTGRYPQARLGIPAAVDHPRNLFTLLAGAYDMNVHETVSELCPEWLCGAAVHESVVQKQKALLVDASIVYAHFVVPQRLRGRLPSIEGKWRDFTTPPVPVDEDAFESKAMAATGADRGAAFDRFVESVVPRSRPTLHFHHTVLPHTPFTYLPTGRAYDSPRDIWGLKAWALNVGTWVRDPAPVELAQLRYLLQLGFADQLLGRLLDRLEATGLLDTALVVVTADHGAAFVPGEPHRTLATGNYLQVAPVPLFIKEPGQREAVISDRPTETVDVLPTIAALVGIVVPWYVDGVSALAPTLRETRQFVRTSGESGHFPFGVGALNDTVARRIARFGAGSPWPTIFAHGAYAEMLGQPAERFALVEAAPYALRLRSGGAPEVRDVGPLPVYVFGELVATGAAPPGWPVVAIGINGRIVTTVRPVRRLDGAMAFHALLAEESLRAGTNRVEVFVVDDRDPAGVRLLRVPPMATP